jgi:osmotically-inducible protein OsmY
MIKDSQLQKAVQDELAWEPSVSAAHIGVAARDGVVTLSGHVLTYSEKYAAEKAVGRVKGVKAVAEELEVRLPFEVKRTDDEIASAAVQRLAWDSSVPKDIVKVRVENGWLTMTGQVDWKYQQDAAHDALRPLTGVVGVSNHITVRPRPSASDVSADIKRALHRSWSFSQDNVTVTATGGSVRLMGTVPTFDDRRIAASTAWRAPGVTEVENDIAVM